MEHQEILKLLNEAGEITIIGGNEAQVAFKNCAPFIKCITKIDGTMIDDAEDLDLVIPMYDLLEYSLNYSDTAGSLWFYSKDEATNVNANIATNDDFKSFKYKTKLVGERDAQIAPNNNSGILENATITVPLKYLSDFWRKIEMSLTNSKVKLKLK